MEHMNNFVRYVKKVASKSFSKLKIFLGNMRYLIAITENKVQLTIVDVCRRTMQTQVTNFCINKYKSVKYGIIFQSPRWVTTMKY